MAIRMDSCNAFAWTVLLLITTTAAFPVPTPSSKIPKFAEEMSTTPLDTTSLQSLKPAQDAPNAISDDSSNFKRNHVFGRKNYRVQAESTYPSLADNLEDMEEVPATNVPHFISESVKIDAREGENVTFPCMVEDLGSYIRLWRKGTQIFFAGSLPIFRDPRINVTQDASLTITGVQASDTGEYLCQISTTPPLDLVHTLNILVPPKLKTEPESGPIVVRKGEEIQLLCNASGNPKPTVTWTITGGTLPGGQSSVAESVLSIPAGRDNSGIYKCLASNGIEPDAASNSLRVEVLYTPEITVSSSSVYSGEGATVELSCTVHSYPVASFAWLHDDGSPVHENERIKMKSSGNTQILQIRKLMKSDFRNYTCLSNNTLGVSSETVELSDLAAPVTFKSKPYGIHFDSYALSWMVKSHSKVIEYSLDIRKAKDSENSDEPGPWINIAIPAETQPGLLQSQTYEITGLEGATTYEAVMQAHNERGWNRPSPIFVFHTKGVDPYVVPVTAKPNSDSASSVQHSTVQIFGLVAVLMTFISHG